MVLSAGGRLGPRTAHARMRHWHALPDDAARTVWLGINSLSEWNDFIVEGFTRLLRASMNARWGSRGYGLVGVHRTSTVPDVQDWTVGSSWVGVTINSVDDRGLWPTIEGVRHAGSTSTIAANLLSTARLPETVNHFEIIWQDIAGTAGPWAYRIDGGAWINNPATRNGDGAVRRLAVASAVATGIDIRPCNAAGTTATVAHIQGVSYRRTATEGVLTHNFASSGQTASALTRPTFGDSLALLDVLDTPDLVILESGNDCTTTQSVRAEEGNADIWARNMLQFVARLPTATSIVLLTLPPFDPVANPTRPLSLQQEWRDMTLRLGAAIGAPVINIFDLWGGTYDDAVDGGYMDLGDGLHPLQAGHDDIHDRLVALLGV